MLIVIFWLGCQSIEEPVKDTVPTTSSLQDYVFEHDESDSADFDLLAIASELEMVLQTLRYWNAQDVFASYDNALSYQDAYCPQSYTVDGNSFWVGGCQSSQGMRFDGYLFANVYEQSNFFQDGNIWDAQVLSAASDMVYPNESQVHFGGSATLAQGQHVDGYDLFFSSIVGSFLDESMADSWLLDGTSHTLMMYAVHFSDAALPINGFYVNGSVKWTGAVTAVEFRQMATYSAYIGFPCQEEMLGQMGVRDDQGRWLDIAFDVAEDWSLLGECDGCGTVTYQGESIGEVCMDATVLLDWTEEPWLSY